jgi:pimeloyl-ACP methyl ester carboxylesterase
VLIHGFGAGVFAWRRVGPALAAALGMRVVALDRPGFGLSSRQGITLVHFSAQLEPFLTRKHTQNTPNTPPHPQNTPQASLKHTPYPTESA